MKSDLILLPVRSPSGGLSGMHQIVKIIPAREKIGISGDFCNQSLLEDGRADGYYTQRLKLIPCQKEDHELVITYRFLKFLGIKGLPKTLWPELWTNKSDRIWAESAISPRLQGNIMIAIAPGVTSIPGKFYPGKNYAQAFSKVTGKTFQVVILGNSAEKSMCDEVEMALKGLKHIQGVTNLSGKTTIRQFVECIRLCDLLISEETGALHIGVALKRPTIGIVGGGHFKRFYPWGDPEINRIANFPMECYGCNWECRYSEAKCIQKIKPDQIADHIRILLDFIDLGTRNNRKPVLVPC